jgi:lipopolysaccharide export system protein LptA
MLPASSRLLRGCLIALLCLPLPAWPLSTDRNEPINIEADTATLNEASGTSTYRGNVHLRQGTMQLRGENMTVQMRDDRIDKIVLTGNPATYVQRPDNAEEDQHAEAGRIEYYAGENRMILLDNARIWQSGKDQFSSDRIVFNLAENTVNAGGGSSTDRVRITLQPRKSDDTAATPEPTTGAQPATPPGNETPTDTTP